MSVNDYNRKLTMEDAENIRKALRERTATQTELAEMYGVHHTTISGIWRRKIYNPKTD